MPTNHGLAFNAGLTIFGALLVSSKESRHDPSQWCAVEQSRPYVDMAAEALRRLDSGNQVIERCVEYLAQLSMILKATSKCLCQNTNIWPFFVLYINMSRWHWYRRWDRHQRV